MLSFDQFLDFYKKNKKFPFNIYTPKKEWNERQIKTKYEKYVQSCGKKKERDKKTAEKQRSKQPKVDQKWAETRKKVFEEKGTKCWYMLTLTYSKLSELINKSNGMYLIIDIAHILPKDLYPELYYDIDNLIPLNRFSHHCLDYSLHPVTGKSISRKERDVIMKSIISEKSYGKLLEKVKKIRSEKRR